MSGFGILLIDDHALFAQGLKFLLGDLRDDVEFIVASGCEEALRETEGCEPDLILLDYHLGGEISESNALAAVRAAHESATIVVLSSEDDPQIVLSAVENGAAGFIFKSSTPEIMIAALQLVLAGGVYLPPIAAASHAFTGGAAGSIVDLLSDRQREVLMSAIRGKPNKIIARELGIAEGTVKAHLSASYRIIGVRNRTEAVFRAAELGLRSRGS